MKTGLVRVIFYSLLGVATLGTATYALSQTTSLRLDGGIAVKDVTVIDDAGRWVGDPTNLQGPPGPPGPGTIENVTAGKGLKGGGSTDTVVLELAGGQEFRVFSSGDCVAIGGTPFEGDSGSDRCWMNESGVAMRVRTEQDCVQINGEYFRGNLGSDQCWLEPGANVDTRNEENCQVIGGFTFTEWDGQRGCWVKF